MAAVCVITGCNLADPLSHKWIHGDLLKLGDIYIFNASGCEWQHGAFPPKDERNVLCMEYYEKNSVIVFHKKSSRLNGPATNHIKEG
jgi:hypothetical protein